MKQLIVPFALLLLGSCGNASVKPESNEESSSGTMQTMEVSASTQNQTDGSADEKNGRQKFGSEETGAEGLSGNGTQIGNPTFGEDQGRDESKLTSEFSTGGERNNPKANGPGFGASSFLPDEEGEEIVFVGSFAQWRPGNGDAFDGSYDAFHNLFVVCKTAKCQKVPRNEIFSPEFGNCDEPLENRIKSFKIKKNGEAEQPGTIIQIVGNEGLMEVNGVPRAIKIDQQTRERINSEKRLELRRLNPTIIKEKPVLMAPQIKKEETSVTRKATLWQDPEEVRPASDKQALRQNRSNLNGENTKKPAQALNLMPAQNQQNLSPSATMQLPGSIVAQSIPAVTVTLMRKTSADSSKVVQKQAMPPVAKPVTKRFEKKS